MSVDNDAMKKLLNIIRVNNIELNITSWYFHGLRFRFSKNNKNWEYIVDKDAIQEIVDTNYIWEGMYKYIVHLIASGYFE